MRPTTIHFQPKSHSRSVHKFCTGRQWLFFCAERRSSASTSDNERLCAANEQPYLAHPAERGEFRRTENVTDNNPFQTEDPLTVRALIRSG